MLAIGYVVPKTPVQSSDGKNVSTAVLFLIAKFSPEQSHPLWLLSLNDPFLIKLVITYAWYVIIMFFVILVLLPAPVVTVQVMVWLPSIVSWFVFIIFLSISKLLLQLALLPLGLFVI